MRSVGIRVLKNRLSEYVRMANAGERVLVTDRDRVVAELVPPAAGRAETLSDAVLAEAVRQGWLVPPLVITSGSPPRLPVAAFRDLMRELESDRDEK